MEQIGVLIGQGSVAKKEGKRLISQIKAKQSDLIERFGFGPGVFPDVPCPFFENGRFEEMDRVLDFFRTIIDLAESTRASAMCSRALSHV